MHSDPRLRGSDAITALRTVFDDAEVIELTFTVAQFIGMGQLIHAMGIPNPDAVAPSA